MVALEIAIKLEKLGRKCHLYLVDSAPAYVRGLTQISLRKTEASEEEEIQNLLLLQLVDLIAPQDTQEVRILWPLFIIMVIFLYLYDLGLGSLFC